MPTTSPQPVTLLLPNRNNERVLELMLERLLAHTTYGNFELVIVDDGSTDDSRRILRAWRDSQRFDNLTLIEKEHEGVVVALNTGLAAASGELVVQLDGDATVETRGWLERMVAFHGCDPAVGVVTPLVVFEDRSIHAAGVNIVEPDGLHDRGSYPTEKRGARTVHTLATHSMVDDATELVSGPAEVDAAIGVCMLYARELAEEIGGYDPGFSPVWFDDLDLALSARRLGLKAFFVPGVEVVHRMSLRTDRTAHSDTGRLVRRARKMVARVTPQRIRDSVVNVERRGTPHPPHELRRLRHHYAYWREKWGFDLPNPDMDAVLERHGDSEVCWRYDPARRAAGEDIIEAWSAPAAADSSSA